MHNNVLIVGAGPTGLVLALWLTRQGVRVRIVDKTAVPGTTSRAMAIQARTLEFYRQLDLSEAVVKAGHANPAINIWVNGDRRARISFENTGKLLTPFPFVLIYPQDRHEQLLVAKLQSLGIEVERQIECLEYQDKGDYIDARLRAADGSEHHYQAGWIAGCDGARSTVRNQIGGGFPGGTYDKIFFVADVEASGATANGEAHVALDKSDFVIWLAYGDSGQGRLIGVVDDRHQHNASELSFADVGHQAISRIGLRVEQVNWFSTYHVHHRVTERYRQGRAFLLGDAAHLHSPAGGQGMNTGIGDAINLAWKLAAVIRQQAPDKLLDSYQAERRAFALRLVETTDRVFTLVTAESSMADFVRMHIVPYLAPMAYRFNGVREFMFRTLSQTMISYHHSPISEGRAGELRGGDRLPWVRNNGFDNFASLKAICWQIHLYGDEPHALREWCDFRGIPLRCFVWSGPCQHAGLTQGAAYLLRPDMHIAFIDAHADPQVIEAWLARHGLTIGQVV